MARTYETAIGRLTEGWECLAAYFVPAAMAGDREAYNRARMFLISHLFGPVLGNTVPIALFVFDPTPHGDIAILAASISLFWAFPFLLRRGLAYERLVLLSVINLNFCILFSCYNNGGVTSPTLTWVLIIPILSLFYVGGEQRLQPRLLGITALAFSIFAATYILHPPGQMDLPDAAMLGLGAVSTVATLCYVATMAVYYARIFDAGVDLETEVRRRRQLAEELRKAIVRTHRAGSAKAEFLARMSHELRTPLNAIIGYGQILREEAEERDDRLMIQDIDRILDAARYLVRLITMILDLAKIDAGRMQFATKPSNVEEILRNAVAERGKTISANRNTAAVEVEPGLGTVEVDPHRVLQVLDGLIENAAQHTQDGTITLRAGLCDGSDPCGTFFISIRDTGAGMSAEVMATLFESFSTGRNAADGRYGGTGLCLTVCSQLCRAMGGSIAVASTPGQGSTFTIRLPAAPCARPDVIRPVAGMEAAA
jgi:signal transduction histidine kinase